MHPTPHTNPKSTFQRRQHHEYPGEGEGYDRRTKESMGNVI
jgi:hypothetical protein